MGLHTDVAQGLGGEENSAASFRGGAFGVVILSLWHAG